jgi:signal transduction histidine kinase
MVLRLRTALLLTSAYLLVLAIVALLVPLALSLRHRVDGEVRSQASGQAASLAGSAADLLGSASHPDLTALVRATADRVRGRVIVVGADGRLLTDSAGPARTGARYGGRPELRAALAGHVSQGVRHSATLRTDLLVTAAPIVRRGRVAGAVRVTQSVAAVRRAVRRTVLELILVAGVVLAFGLLVAGLLAGQIARPLLRLERTARDVAGGNLHARAEHRGTAEQRSLAGSFNEMTDRLTMLLGAQRRFVADASHQLRTPLTGLRLRLEALGTAWPSRAQQSALDAAIVEVDRMAMIVDDLLELSQADARARPGARCDLAAAVRAAQERFAGPARAAGVVLRACGEEPAIGSGEREDIDRALDVLVDNALRYGAAGHEVDIDFAPGRIEVRDRGPGPSAGEEEAVFERFHRGSAAQGRPPGTGLGLSIVRALARGWGGEATLRARPGGGAVAALVIPAPFTPDGDAAADPGLEVTA